MGTNIAKAMNWDLKDFEVVVHGDPTKASRALARVGDDVALRWMMADEGQSLALG